MSRKSKDVETRKNYQKIFVRFILEKKFSSEVLYGYHTWPQVGPGAVFGDLRVHDQCGLKLMDPATIQGTRIIRNIKARVIEGSNSIYKNIGVYIYKYNDAYGGAPCCDYEPTPDADSANPNQARYSISNFQNMLGQSVFHNNDLTEHEINVEGEYLMESGDVLCVSFGNLNMFGTIVPTTGGHYTYTTETVSGTVLIAGTIEYEIAFL